ncbi:hypothetical protein PR048_028385 [Dryococelus australis]|uniref:Reverse transcriptase domain-containing protein n=1 Tax=Dryococelus australis TaxID=614101 RepID=A0ABQ9GJ51_9NEOP|nr:hypothetical protein PR048_028385 [Dryococelus australis]
MIDALGEKMSRFSQMITFCTTNRTVPLRIRRVTKPPDPWLTNDIVQLMRKHDNAYSRYKRDIRTNVPAADSFDQYRMLRNKCTQLARRDEMLYSLDSFGSCRTSGDFWKRLRNLGIGKCKTNISSPLSIHPEDSNSYFVQYFQRLAPASWQYAIVKPLSKRTSVTTLDDFQPIILPAVYKTLEFLVHQQVYKYVNDNKLFDSYQSGFRTGQSTCTALKDIADSIRMAMNRINVTILVLLGRHQCVVIGGKKSTWQPMHLGVPKGSVLGPLLFSLFINDI